MKPTNATLNAILAGRQFFIADLITFTLQDGTVLTYTSGQTNIIFNGSTYACGGATGPYFDRKDNKAKVVWNLGVGTDTLVMDVLPGSTAQVEGHSWFDAVRLGLFDGADFEIDRAYMGSAVTVFLALNFNGTTDDFYLSGINFGLANAAQSWAGWLRTTSAGPAMIVGQTVASGGSPSTVTGWVPTVYVGNDGKLYGGLYTGVITALNSTALVNDGLNHHFVFTASSTGAVKLYLDGSSVASASSWATPQSSFWVDTFIGNGKLATWPASGTSTIAFFPGVLADLRVYNRVITSGEVTTLFNAGSVASGLVSEYTMASTLATDSVDGNTGTVQGAPTLVTNGFSGINPASTGGGYGTVQTGCAPMLFKGRVAEVEADRAVITFSINDYRELLNQQMPRWLYAASCQNALYDASCTLISTNFQSTGSVGAGSSFSFIINTTLAQASGYFDLGKIKFTSGANNGLVFPISSWSSSLQTITLAAQTAFLPAVSDQFTIFPGCDLSTGSGGCGKFSNIANFRGMPYIPDPGQAV